jgi:hypothetical protein
VAPSLVLARDAFLQREKSRKTLCDSPGCFCHKPVLVSLFVLLLLSLLLLVLLLLLFAAAAVSFFGGERGRSMLIEMRVFKS